MLFLNPDAEVTPGRGRGPRSGVLDGRPDVGAAGPRTRSADGTIQVSTGPDLTLASEWAQRRLVRGVARRDQRALAEAEARHAREHEPDWVSGACLLARREALEAVGGFDERFFLYEEDADLCRRLRVAGWRVVFTPAAEVRHRLGHSMARGAAAGAARVPPQPPALLPAAQPPRLAGGAPPADRAAGRSRSGCGPRRARTPRAEPTPWAACASPSDGRSRAFRLGRERSSCYCRALHLCAEAP